MQGSDFVMTFYPVGKLLLAGRAAEIYPPPTAISFVEAPFNKYVHELLTFLNPRYVAIYMYSPLMALLFVPFALGSATQALVAWQFLSVMVMALVAWLCGRGAASRGLDYFFMFALFCPIFHTLLIGHLGIVVGLLPLALGYVLLSRCREFAGGFIWGALLLKPQFLPAAMLVAGSLFLAKRPRAAFGLGCGLLVFGALSSFALGPQLFFDWLKSFKMSDTIFANAGYGFPAYMVVSLPAVLLQSFPFEARATAKLFIYALAAAIGLYALWRGTAILRKLELGGLSLRPGGNDAAMATVEQVRQYRAGLTLVMLYGLLVLPLVLPHFLFYDMCGLALIAVLAYQGFVWGTEQMRLRQIRTLSWWGANLYYLSFMFCTVAPFGQWYALLLVLYFAWLLWLSPGFIGARVSSASEEG